MSTPTITEQDVVQFLQARRPKDSRMLAAYAWNDGSTTWNVLADSYRQDGLIDSLDKCVDQFENRGSAWKNQRINELTKAIEDSQAELSKLTSSL